MKSPEIGYHSSDRHNSMLRMAIALAYHGDFRSCSCCAFSISARSTSMGIISTSISVNFCKSSAVNEARASAYASLSSSGVNSRISGHSFASASRKIFSGFSPAFFDLDGLNFRLNCDPCKMNLLVRRRSRRRYRAIQPSAVEADTLATPGPIRYYAILVGLLRRSCNAQIFHRPRLPCFANLR
jgi:hypothetical protein